DAPPQPTPQPSPTYTATPPTPDVPPQVWRTLTDTLLNDLNTFSGEWDDVPDKEWEYEVLSYNDQEALFLQYDQPEELFYTGAQSVVDLERSLTLAIPDEDGRIDLVCRWQNGRGYALALTNQRWALLEIDNGSEVVLADGAQPEGFRQGEYGDFRLRCVGQQISAWRGQSALASEQDGSYADGSTGLRFTAPGGISLAYIASDRLRTHVIGQDTAGLSDSVRMGLLEVTAPRGVQDYPAMKETEYAGQPLVGIRVRFSNQDSSQAVFLDGQNIYLTNGQQRVYALGFVPQSAGEVQSLTLPQTIQAGATAVGEVFFAGVSAADLSNGWQLVIDLRYQALGEARFAIE
ncbi:MAG TPA: hypothetical protein VJ965_08520, partial [Anaerolineales bacterium]|nr:hypothetical protein [Anaerolineales bacterium]